MSNFVSTMKRFSTGAFGVVLASALCLGVGTTAAAAEDRPDEQSDKQTAYEYVQQINEVRQKQRDTLTPQLVVGAQQEDLGADLSQEGVAEADVSGKPAVELRVNSDLMRWAQARAHALANSSNTGSEEFPSHDDMYRDAPQWAEESARNLQQSPDYTKNHMFGPEALYVGELGNNDAQAGSTQNGSAAQDGTDEVTAQEGPVAAWERELTAAQGAQRQGYDQYLTMVNRYADVAGMACEVIAQGPRAGESVCVLEVGFDVGQGKTQSVSDAKAGREPLEADESDKRNDASPEAAQEKSDKKGEQQPTGKDDEKLGTENQDSALQEQQQSQSDENGAKPAGPATKADTASVCFYPNDGSSGNTTCVNVEIGKPVAKPANPTRKGYTFKGWSESPWSSPVVYYDFSKPVTNRYLSLSAVWEGHPYTVNYQANGGAGFMLPQKNRVGDRTYARPSAFTSVGKNFLAWNTKADGTGTAVEANSPMGDLTYTADSVTLYAQWTTGVPSSIDTVTLDCHNDYGYLYCPLPERVTVRYSDGHALQSRVSWASAPLYNESSDRLKDGEKVSITGVVAATPLLRAKLVATVIDRTMPVFSGMDDVTVSVGSKFNVLEGITATDGVYGDISKSIKADKQVDTSQVGSTYVTYTVATSRGTKAQASRTITVTNQPLVTVHFDANGGTGTMSDQNFAKDSWQRLRSSRFTRKPVWGMESWNTKPDGSGTSYSLYGTSFSVDTTLYAQWVTGTMSYYRNVNDSTIENSMNNAQVKWDSIVVKANLYTNPGYHFASWNTKADGTGTSYSPGQVINGYATAGFKDYAYQSLYAQWVPDSYQVQFNANGGTGTMPSQQIAYDKRTALQANTFAAPQGKYFAGWNTKANGTGASYTDMQYVSKLSTSAPVTLYAQYAVSDITSLAVQTPPTKQQYTTGQAFKAEGLKVVGITKGAAVKALPASSYSLSAVNTAKTGTQKVTVTLKSDTSKTAWFPVYIGVSKPTVAATTKVQDDNKAPENYVVNLDASSSKDVFDRAVTGARAQRAFILMQYPQINVFFVQAQTGTFGADFARWAAANGVTVNSVAPSSSSLRDDELRHTDVQPSETATVQQLWQQSGADFAPAKENVDVNTNVDNAWGIDAIGAGQAQGVQVPQRPTMVGVIDSGIAADHPDLKGKVDPSLSVSCVANGVPTQGKASDGHYVWEPRNEELGDGNGSHGTHVAGTIAGAHNGSGVDGVSPDSRLAAIKVLYKNRGTLITEVCGYMWAGQAHVDVTNASLGSTSPMYPDTEIDAYSEVIAEQRAVDFAKNQGVVNVVSAGNSGYDLDNIKPNTRSLLTPRDRGVKPDESEVPTTLSKVMGKSEGSMENRAGSAGKGWITPAMLDGVVTVSAVQKESSLVVGTMSRSKQLHGGLDCQQNGWCSNYGTKTIDVAAPGSDIVSAYVSSISSGYSFDYASMSGTSMASPHAAGVAALIKSIHPDFTPDQTVKLLKQQAHETYSKLKAPTDGAEYRGAGLVNAYAAVTENQPQPKVSLQVSTNNGVSWTALQGATVTGKALVRATVTGPVTKATLTVPGYTAVTKTASGALSGSVAPQVAVDYSGLKTAQKVTVKVDAYGRNNDSHADDDVHQSVTFTAGKAATAPTPSKPQPSNPAPAKPEPSKPTPSQPAPSKPTPSKPQPSQPSPSKPEPSKPQPSKPSPSQPSAGQGSVRRLAGALRYDTAGKVVSEAFPGKAATVVLASGGNYPDALAASGLAGALNAPVMLTDAQSLSSQARDQISRLKPSRVIIVGGTSAVSKDVERAVSKLVSAKNVTRIAGNTRYDTAAMIYEQGVKLGAQWSDTAIVSTGGGFADALSVSPYSYARKAPIFLSDSKSGLTAKTVADVKARGFKKVIIVGGTTAVPSKVEAQVKSAGVKSVDRVQGWSRYATSEAIAQYAVKDGTLGVSNPVFATGSNFPDALAGGSLAGSKKSVLVLTNPADTKDKDVSATLSWLGQSKASVKQAYILGGTSAVSKSMSQTISKSLGLKAE